MKKLLLVVAISIISIGFSTETFAGELLKIIEDFIINNPGGGSGSGGGSVGAPIDGGLLTILGSAGIGYYFVRRKNKKK